MSTQQPALPVRCHNCHKAFPFLPARDDEERQAAKALLEKRAGSLRVACWCPWCQETNMVEVPVKLVPSIETFRRGPKCPEEGTVAVLGDPSEVLDGLKPRPGEEEGRGRRR